MNKEQNILALESVIGRLIEASRLHSTMKKAAKLEKAVAKAASEYFTTQGAHVVNEFLKRSSKVAESARIREADGEEDEIPFEMTPEEAEKLSGELIESTPRQLMLPFMMALDEKIKNAFLMAAAEAMAGLQSGMAEEHGHISFDVKHPEAVSFMYQKGGVLIKKIDETTREIIRGVLIRGIDKGYSQDKIAKQIIERFGQMAVLKPQQHILTRANLIAATEIGNAYQEGNLRQHSNSKQRAVSK